MYDRSGTHDHSNGEQDAIVSGTIRRQAQQKIDQQMREAARAQEREDLERKIAGSFVVWAQVGRG